MAARDDMIRRVVIIGAGHAGVQAAASLRDHGFDGEIALIHGEKAAPYRRPPLSKAYLSNGDADRLAFRGAEWFAANRIDLVAVRARNIDRLEKRVETDSGATLAYDHLILATGSRARQLVPKLAGDAVHYLDDIVSARCVRERLARSKRVVILGAGFIGLEFAAAARAAGAQVDVVDTAPRVMARVVSATASAFFEGRHRAAGVRLHLGVEAPEISMDAAGDITVACANGLTLAGDMLLVGIGAAPDVVLAHAAGLAVERGVAVDMHLLTSDPDISAIGDCAAFPGPDDQRLCLACVQNAVDQAKFVAARIMGAAQAYRAVPWFWSDQGPDKLQIAGLAAVADEDAVRADPDGRAISVLRFRHGRLTALETVNRPGEHMLARKLFDAGDAPDRAALSAVGFDLRAFVGARARVSNASASPMTTTERMMT
jgi:3-phenylpropionate/trans-cinnamate dioxygenase ferredoxin reductase component